MPAVQSTYNTTQRPAFAGMKADMSPETVITRTVETAAGIGFGKAVFQGTGDRQIVVADGTATFVGVALSDEDIYVPSGGTVDTYPVGSDAKVMLQGTVWVTVGAAVAAGEPAYIVPATGVFTNVATANTLVGRFDTSAANGALAILRMI